MVIEVSPFGEDPTPALESAQGIFDDIHITCHGGETPPLANVTYHANGALDATKIKNMSIVRVPADLRFRREAVDQIHRDMDKFYSSCEHYAVCSTTNLASDSIWYGFLIVILMLDTLRSIVSLFQYQRTCDMRAAFVHRTYPDRVYEARPSTLRWWLFTGILRTRRLENTCAQQPIRPDDQGFRFVWRTIYTHKTMGFGLLWTLGFLLYYYLFSLVFYSLGVIWLALHLLNYFCVAYLVHQYLLTNNAPILIVQVLLFPLYLTLFPLVYLFCRFMPPRTIKF